MRFPICNVAESVLEIGHGAQRQGRNPKSQALNPKQIPNPKLQTPTRAGFEIGIWKLDIVWDLEFGTWRFSSFSVLLCQSFQRRCFLAGTGVTERGITRTSAC
jgi:hypothetical protein